MKHISSRAASNSKELARQKRPAVHRIVHTCRKRYNQHIRTLFEIPTNKFRPHFNETIKSLQFPKLNRQNGENAEEWMGRWWLLVIECNYKELNRQLKEQFIHGLNDTNMLGEIIWELTKMHENREITSKMCCPGQKS